MAKQKPVSTLEDHLGYWLRYVSNHVSHAFECKLAAQGVTVAEWVVLSELLRQGPVNPSQLASELGMTRGAISKLIERLCNKELAQRTTLEHDRRFQKIEVTGAGKQLVPRLAELADANDTEFFGHLRDSEHRQMISLLQDIVRRHEWKAVPVE